MDETRRYIAGDGQGIQGRRAGNRKIRNNPSPLKMETYVFLCMHHQLIHCNFVCPWLQLGLMELKEHLNRFASR